jgi:hypothetical protein
MATKTKKYEVTLLASNQSGAKRTYYRGGLQFTVLEPQVLELTNEEVKVFKDDARLKVKSVSGKSESDESETASDSESDAPTTTTETTEEDSTTEDTDSEDSSSDEAEEDSDEATDSTDEVSDVDTLVKDNSREALNAKAVELGVENPERKEWTKTEVAQAIVEAEASNSESEATS